MKKIAIALIGLLTVIILTSCPGIADPPPKDEPVPPSLSSNAALSGLTITTGSVDHVYTSVVSSYFLTVSNAVESITVTPILSDSNASLTINDVSLENISITVPISVGENTFTLIVTAEDGETTSSYSVVITRLDGSVSDTTAPVITLSGDNPLTMEVNISFTEPGYSAVDDMEGNLTSAVVVTGTVDTSTVGSYTLSYNVSDTSGNAATEVTRTVNVMAALEAPTISLASGTYTLAQTVTINHPVPGVRIYYTLDNTWIPYNDDSVGSIYSGEITVSEPTTLIARAFLDGLNSSPGTREDYAIVLPGETNMIANGDFNNDLALWHPWTYNQSNADASFSVVDGVFTVNIVNGGENNWNVATDYEPRFLLEQDEYYQLDFTSWAAGEREINVNLQENGIDNNGDGGLYSGYYGNTINLTTSPQNFSFQMRMDDIDDPQADLRFNFGIETADVYIDNISLEKVVPVILTTTDVPDANLRQAFEDATGKTFGTDLTDMDLAALENLDIEVNGQAVSISTMKGLEYCDSVTHLNFDDCDLSGCDTTSSGTSAIALEGMAQLSKIRLNNNNLTKIRFISGLSQLTGLYVRGNIDLDITDFSDLTPTNHPALQYLYLSGWDLNSDGNVNSTDVFTGTDWAGVCNLLKPFLNFRSLELSNFHIGDSDFSLLFNSGEVLDNNSNTLGSLFLGNNNITSSSLNLIGGLSQLGHLVMNYTFIDDLSSLISLTRLEFIDISGTTVSNLTPLKTLYDGGAFQNHYDYSTYDIDLTNCNLDLRPGNSNRDVVDYLINHGVRVDYETGNQTDNGTIDITIQ